MQCRHTWRGARISRYKVSKLVYFTRFLQCFTWFSHGFTMFYKAFTRSFTRFISWIRNDSHGEQDDKCRNIRKHQRSPNLVKSISTLDSAEDSTRFYKVFTRFITRFLQGFFGRSLPVVAPPPSRPATHKGQKKNGKMIWPIWSRARPPPAWPAGQQIIQGQLCF